jgi:hypothetical protein
LDYWAKENGVRQQERDAVEAAAKKKADDAAAAKAEADRLAHLKD